MFNKKNILLFGLGVTGKACLHLLTFLNANVTVMSSELNSPLVDAACPYLCDKSAKISNGDFDYIVISPGISTKHPAIQHLTTKIIGEIELCYLVLRENNLLPKKIIGITGSNGKTTTTTILKEMCLAENLDAFVGGNIGVPWAFDVVLILQNLRGPRAIVILELSSFQLETIFDFHPQIAVSLNLFNNHGERYTNIGDYGKAKARMLINMKNEEDLFLYDQETFSEFVLPYSKNKIHWQPLSHHNLPFDETQFEMGQFKLIGKHNRYNMAVAIIIAQKLNISTKSIQTVIDEFGGVPHRIEWIKQNKYPCWNFYNDAKSTNFTATETAIEAVMEAKKGKIILIMGGKFRGHGDSIIHSILKYKKIIHQILLIGETSDFLAGELSSDFSLIKCRDIKKAIEELEINYSRDDKLTVLFSPAYPSFDQFLNYADRGDQFKRLVIS